MDLFPDVLAVIRKGFLDQTVKINLARVPNLVPARNLVNHSAMVDEIFVHEQKKIIAYFLDVDDLTELQDAEEGGCAYFSRGFARHAIQAGRDIKQCLSMLPEVGRQGRIGANLGDLDIDMFPGSLQLQFRARLNPAAEACSLLSKATLLRLAVAV